jgi:hypothetical protein
MLAPTVCNDPFGEFRVLVELNQIRGDFGHVGLKLAADKTFEFGEQAVEFVEQIRDGSPIEGRKDIRILVAK